MFYRKSLNIAEIHYGIKHYHSIRTKGALARVLLKKLNDDYSEKNKGAIEHILELLRTGTLSSIIFILFYCLRYKHSLTRRFSPFSRNRPLRPLLPSPHLLHPLRSLRPDADCQSNFQFSSQFYSLISLLPFFQSYSSISLLLSFSSVRPEAPLGTRSRGHYRHHTHPRRHLQQPRTNLRSENILFSIILFAIRDTSCCQNRYKNIFLLCTSFCLRFFFLA